MVRKVNEFLRYEVGKPQICLQKILLLQFSVHENRTYCEKEQLF